MHSGRMRQFQSKSFRFHFSKEFRNFQNPSCDLNERARLLNQKRIFVLPFGFAFIESTCSPGTNNLNPLQRLNEAYPEHSFHSLVVRRGTNSPWRAWRLRSFGVEAV